MKSGTKTAKKSARVILVALFSSLILAGGATQPWLLAKNQPTSLIVLTILSGLIWWIVFVWSLYQLIFQLFSLFSTAQSNLDGTKGFELPDVAILYATRDDFDAESCDSCLQQDYQGQFTLLICDDSQDDETRTRIDAYAQQHGNRCKVLRRDNLSGFKAGNLNAALQQHDTSEWFLLVDADQQLPIGFLSSLVNEIPIDSEGIAFLQAAQQAMSNGAVTRLQNSLAPGVDLFYQRDLELREKYGFVPLVGHGALVRYAVWKKLQFPELVSEDFAFSLRAVSHGQRGVYLHHIHSFEMLPVDFGGFILRLKKYSSATAELLRKEYPSFVRGNATFAEVWDFTFQVLGYVLTPLILLNLFLGAYVVHQHWISSANNVVLPTIMPFLYALLPVSLFALAMSVTKNFVKTIRFLFWSTAIYTATTPIAAWHFIRGLFTRPTFTPTPKGGQTTPLAMLDTVLTVILGIMVTIVSVNWYSLLSPVLLGIGIAYIGYPLYGETNADSLLGNLARIWIYLPGFLMLLGTALLWIYVLS